MRYVYGFPVVVYCQVQYCSLFVFYLIIYYWLCFLLFILVSTPCSIIMFEYSVNSTATTFLISIKHIIWYDWKSENSNNIFVSMHRFFYIRNFPTFYFGWRLLWGEDYFGVIVGVQLLQFMVTVALVNSLVKMSLPVAVSWHNLLGIP